MRFRFALAALFCMAATTLPAEADAQKRRRSDASVVEVSLGGSTFVSLSGGAGKVTLTDPTVADITPAAGGLLVVGRKVGETNLILYGGGSRQTYLIKVSLPARAIQTEIARLFTREDIEARAVGGSLVLIGVVTSTEIVKQAEELALGYLRSPSIAALGVQPHVINMLRVRQRQQVQLQVKFAEVNRRSLREIGMNVVGGLPNGRVGAAGGRAAAQDTNPRFGGSHSSIVGAPAQVFNPVSAEGAFGSIFLGMNDGPFPFAATLNLLAANELSRTLAEPTLVAMSGQTASFLAGGELPFQTDAGNNRIQIELKPFGIELAFTPTVLADDTIQMITKFRVSAVDPTLAITTGVNTANLGFKSRGATTTVRLRDSQSFAIAGLINDEMANRFERIPGLGDIPILGVLFSSKKYDRKETELVVVVTARLVEPLDADSVPPLPGEEQISDPTDLELFLLNIKRAKGRRSGGVRGSAAAPARQPVGPVGFWR